MIEIQTRNGKKVIIDGDTPTDFEINQGKLKAERNALLADTDLYMVEDYPITAEVKEQWKVYRQKLRNMNFSSLDNVVWPVPPGESNGS